MDIFKEGWAIPIFTNCQRAHYYKGFTTADSWVAPECGGAFVPSSQLLAEGSYPRCKRCERALSVVEG